MAKQHNLIVKQYSIYVLICFMRDKNNMILKKELDNIKMHRVSLSFNAFKIKLVDTSLIIYSIYHQNTGLSFVGIFLLNRRVLA
jgi:hypothetical protein